jgi:plastocyanin
MGNQATAGAADYTAYAQPVESSLSRLLAASGVPSDSGKVRWPHGLQILAASGSDELREQIDSLFQVAATQAASGAMSERLGQELGRSVKTLRGLLLKDKQDRFCMPLVMYTESERFLDRLERGAQSLQAGLAGSGRLASLTAYGAPGTVLLAQVALADNQFQPGTITVPAGSTVQWTNHGRHGHTVTSDDGEWDSGELGAHGVYQHTFTRAGTYSYHCSIHPDQMRGTVVVK